MSDLRTLQPGESELWARYTTIEGQALQDIGIVEPVNEVFADGVDSDPLRAEAIEKVQEERRQLGFRDTFEQYRVGMPRNLDDGRRLVVTIEHGLMRKPWRVSIVSGAETGSRLEVLRSDDHVVQFRLSETALGRDHIIVGLTA